MPIPLQGQSRDGNQRMFIRSLSLSLSEGIYDDSLTYTHTLERFSPLNRTSPKVRLIAGTIWVTRNDTDLPMHNFLKNSLDFQANASSVCCGPRATFGAWMSFRVSVISGGGPFVAFPTRTMVSPESTA